LIASSSSPRFFEAPFQAARVVVLSGGLREPGKRRGKWGENLRRETDARIPSRIFSSSDHGTISFAALLKALADDGRATKRVGSLLSSAANADQRLFDQPLWPALEAHFGNRARHRPASRVVYK
jgi:hypothetical protein